MFDNDWDKLEFTIIIGACMRSPPGYLVKASLYIFLAEKNNFEWR